MEGRVCATPRSARLKRSLWNESHDTVGVGEPSNRNAFDHENGDLVESKTPPQNSAALAEDIGHEVFADRENRLVLRGRKDAP